jgi:sensor histidine kinase YesM
MKTLREHWRLWLAIVVGWTLFGLAYTFHYYFYAVHYTEIFKPPPTLRDMLIWEMPYWLLWAALSPLVFVLTRRFRLERGHLLSNCLYHIAFCVALALAHRAVYLLIGWVLHVADYRRLASLYEVYNKNFFFNLPNGFMCYATILLVGYAITYYNRHQEEEVEISRLETVIAQTQLQMGQAQLQALKMQLHPHFLFNTLQSISDLLHEDAEAADEMLARLGDFLRLTLEHSGEQEVMLRKEIGFLNCYFDIEQVRFQDRLMVEMNIEPDTLEARVPSLILQPIVENAIRHGIAARVGRGHIKIRSSHRGGRLRLEVEDNGPGLHAASKAGNGLGHGRGLRLTRERLEHSYKTSQQLLLSEVPGGGLRVMLEIPYVVRGAAPAEKAVKTEGQVAAT